MLQLLLLCAFGSFKLFGQTGIPNFNGPTFSQYVQEDTNIRGLLNSMGHEPAPCLCQTEPQICNSGTAVVNAQTPLV